MNKLLSSACIRRGYPNPDFAPDRQGCYLDIPQLIRDLGLPLVVKPACAGSSVGMTIVKKEADMDQAIQEGFAHDDT